MIGLFYHEGLLIQYLIDITYYKAKTMSKRRVPSIANMERKKRRIEEQNQKDDELFTDVTTKGVKIMPSNIKKYTGSIFCRTDRKRNWESRISSNGYKKSKCHATEEEAEAHLKEVNIRENLPIKNIIYEYNGQYYCTLTQKKLMLFSYENIDSVNSYFWGLSNTVKLNSRNKPYAVAYVKSDKKKRLFHQLIFPDKKGETVDHINRNSLDDCRENLRPASRQLQNINQDIKSNNTSGVKGVSYNKQNKAWCATWVDENGSHLKSFSISKHDDAKQEATAFRENIERTVPLYKEALYPQRDEL
jgi:hypothetical protein